MGRDANWGFFIMTKKRVGWMSAERRVAARPSTDAGEAEAEGDIA
jgi:hypothetical protein